MAEQFRLALGAYNRAGLEILRLAAADERVSDLALFTHEPRPGTPDLRREARELGVWHTTDRLGESKPPFCPDVVSLVYYRFIVPREVIGSVEGRIFNAHPSLLPRHRGCSSIPWAIIEGDKVTGVTYHYVDETVDTGRVILQSVLQLSGAETQLSLYERCMTRAVQLWTAAVTLVLDGFPGVQQEGVPCFHRRGAPHGGVIDEAWPDDCVERFIRAMDFPPYPYARYRDHEVRTFQEFQRLRQARS